MSAKIVIYNTTDIETLKKVAQYPSFFVSTDVAQDIIQPYGQSAKHLNNIDLLNACIKDVSFKNDVIIIDRPLRFNYPNWFDMFQETAEKISCSGIIGQKYSIMRQTELPIMPNDFEFAKTLFGMDMTGRNGNFFYFALPSIVYIKKDVIQKISGFDTDLDYTAAGLADFCLKAYCYHERYTELTDDNITYHSPSNSFQHLDILKNKHKTFGEDIHQVCKNVISAKILT